MARQIYVGNLPEDVTDEELRAFFRQAGTVDFAQVVRYPETGKSSGFGYLEMATDAEGDKAIEMFDGYTVEGRQIKVGPAEMARTGYPPNPGDLTMSG